MQVLIAEDNAGIRTVIEGLLKAWEYEVIAVTNGTDAWQILQGENPPRLVILDWMMPGMDGLEICRRMRETTTATPAYVIFLTCRDNTQDIVTGLEAGADDYITKPFEAEELQARLQVGKRVLTMQDSLSQWVDELSRQGNELSRVNRALRLLYAAGQLLVKAETENDLLQDICRLIVETGGYRLAWVGLADGNPDGVVRPHAFAGNDDILRVSWSGQPHERRSFHLLNTTQPTISKNVGNDQFFMPRKGGLPEGYAAVINLPLQHNAQIFGELHIYAASQDAFDHEEARLLGRLAGDLAFGIVAQRSTEERRRSERALKVERDRAQLYLDEAGVLLMALNDQGQITLINRKGCEILGYSEQELLGQNWFMNFHNPENRKEARQIFTELLNGKTGTSDSFVQTIVTKGGAERVLEIHNSLILGHEGEVTGVLFSGTDITERQKAEAALRESEDNYRILFDRFVNSANALTTYKTNRP
jgi:PAS domain S-box-containing protein